MISMQPLPRSFFDRNAKEVAPELIGCLLVRRDGHDLRVGRIVETEAYVGEHDLACHARVGKTARTEVMYGPPGHAYVYLIYGLHPMLNVVCGPGGHPSAVLVRAAESLPDQAGRGFAPLLHSATGPGNLTKAFAIGLGLNRADLCSADSPLYVAPRPDVAAPRIWRSPRVGVDYSGKWAKALLRCCDRGSPAVSRPRPPARKR